MALNAHEADFYLSGAASAGGAQPDPLLSLGGFRSSTLLYPVQSTFTAAASSGAFRVVDAAQIGQAHAGRWMLVMTGACGGAVGFFAARVAVFDSATGTFGLDRPLPAAVASGNVYRLFDPGNVFDAVSAAEAASGLTDYRMVVLRNVTGSVVNGARYHVEQVGVAARESVAVLARGSSSSDATSYFQTSSDLEEPPVSSFGGVAAGWSSPLVRNDPVRPQPVSAVQVGSTFNNAVWLRRSTPAQLGRFSGSGVWKLVLSSTQAGVDPNPFGTAVLLVWSSAGFAPVPAFGVDRALRIGGGARLELRLSDVLGAPVADEVVRFAVASGPGALVEEEAVTDSRGDARVVYLSPTDPMDAGATVELEARSVS